jgi:hypothetical protein
MTPPTRNATIRRSPRGTGKAPVARRSKAGKRKKSTPARKSLNGFPTGSKDKKGKKRIESSTFLGVSAQKGRSTVPRRAPMTLLPSDSESSFTDSNGEKDDDEDDDDDGKNNASIGDGNGEAAQETTDDEGRGKGNDNGENSSDNTSEISSNRKKRRHLQAVEEERRPPQAEGEDNHGDERDEEAVDTSLTRTGRPASAAVRSTGGNSILNLDAPSIHIRGMSKTESLRNQQPHVAHRVRAFVKAELFRKIKFVNNDAMFQRAINLVMDRENVAHHQRGRFQMIYESTFNDALNQKRSSCEQSAGDIVRESIVLLRESGSEMFTMEELCKLRRSQTEREQEAFLWFFGAYLESVCGKRNWGKKKGLWLISEATEVGGRAKMVTKSDEAFALLIFENYIDKWASTTPDAGAEGDDNVPGNGGHEVPVQGKKKQSKVRGLYTSKKSGHCKYGGWSREGVSRFNELYRLVHEDRACPQAAAMERKLLAYCADGEEDGGTAIAGSAITEIVSSVEAAWDLDD